jgi:hypothetical protein
LGEKVTDPSTPVNFNQKWQAFQESVIFSSTESNKYLVLPDFVPATELVAWRVPKGATIT